MTKAIAVGYHAPAGVEHHDARVGGYVDIAARDVCAVESLVGECRLFQVGHIVDLAIGIHKVDVACGVDDYEAVGGWHGNYVVDAVIAQRIHLVVGLDLCVGGVVAVESSVGQYVDCRLKHHGLGCIVVGIIYFPIAVCSVCRHRGDT